MGLFEKFVGAAERQVNQQQGIIKKDIARAGGMSDDQLRRTAGNSSSSMTQRMACMQELKDRGYSSAT